jgi:PST family polysaccharide transporter
VLVVGRIGDAGLLGTYNVAAELAGMATQEIIFPLGRALFPSYATLVGDKKKLIEVFLNVLAAVSMLTIPMSLGLSIVAEEFVHVVLGQQWTGAIPFLRWLAIYGLLYAWTLTLTGNILLVSGHERRSALAIWLNLAIMIPCVLAGSWFAGVEGIVAGITLSAFIALPLMIYLLTTALPVTFAQLAKAVWPSVAAGLLMVTGLLLLTRGAFDTRIAQMAADVATGAGLYVSALLCLWWARGRPDGVERAVVNLLVRRLRRSPSE